MLTPSRKKQILRERSDSTMETWKEPEIVTLELSETMFNINECEHPDDGYGGIFAGGRGFDGCNCGNKS